MSKQILSDVLDDPPLKISNRNDKIAKFEQGG